MMQRQQSNSTRLKRCSDGTQEVVVPSGFSPWRLGQRVWFRIVRVIEFAAGEDSWAAVHEVYYSADGSLKGYSANPAVLMWTADDEAGASQRSLAKFQRALSEPAIKAAEFEK